jgi:hypothetical protein
MEEHEGEPALELEEAKTYSGTPARSIIFVTVINSVLLMLAFHHDESWCCLNSWYF